jgi:two-component system cell cycle sensor histidine kinase/response regulator CckA
LLAFSRKQVMQPQRINLNDIIMNLETLLLKLIGQEIVLHIDTAPSLWDVKADPGQIEQELMNLASNARDAMPDGGHLTISTANEELDRDDALALVGIEPGRFVRLTVADTGQGIPENIRAHIFEPFFTTKDQGKGTGLGLATVYGIVKQSGGWIYLNETPGAGASFRVYLPRVEEQEEEESRT